MCFPFFARLFVPDYWSGIARDQNIFRRGGDERKKRSADSEPHIFVDIGESHTPDFRFCGISPLINQLADTVALAE